MYWLPKKIVFIKDFLWVNFPLCLETLKKLMLIDEHYTEIFFLIMWANQCLEKYNACETISNNCYLKSTDRWQSMWIKCNRVENGWEGGSEHPTHPHQPRVLGLCTASLSFFRTLGSPLLRVGALCWNSNFLQFAIIHHENGINWRVETSPIYFSDLNFLIHILL